MAKYHHGFILSIGRSTHPEWSPQEVLEWHLADGYWYSSNRSPGFLDGQVVLIRYVPGGEMIARARIVDTRLDGPLKKPPEPDLIYRLPVEFLNTKAIEGVYLRDFGITGSRARPGRIGIDRAEYVAIDAAMRAAQ